MSKKQNSNPPVLYESRHEGACKRCGSYVTATAWRKGVPPKAAYCPVCGERMGK